jgi:hypothetical protein
MMMNVLGQISQAMIEHKAKFMKFLSLAHMAHEINRYQ